MSITEVFTYQERVDRAAASFLKLKAKYLERFGLTFRNAIADDWQVNPLDLDAKVWEIQRDKMIKSMTCPPVSNEPVVRLNATSDIKWSDIV